MCDEQFFQPHISFILPVVTAALQKNSTILPLKPQNQPHLSIESLSDHHPTILDYYHLLKWYIIDILDTYWIHTWIHTGYILIRYLFLNSEFSFVLIVDGVINNSTQILKYKFHSDTQNNKSYTPNVIIQPI
jgi:hypothetical protein